MNHFLKKIFLFLLIFSHSQFSFADEGMWIPLLLKQLNETDMQNKGLKLSAEDIYSVNHSSLKDAVLLFGGGCTGEVISDQGLLVTNHHCGYSSIQYLSSMEHNYLKDGFWAYSKEQELAVPNLSVTFIISIENVTQKIISQLVPGIPENLREKKVIQLTDSLTKAAVAGTHYKAFIRPFFYGNEYYMFITETFNDVRLVGAPPEAIGNYGGETDNWIWPRHTGDFSMFRIYAGKDNKPAAYSKENIPFKPRNFLKISTSGIKENDFTMVYGFPGRTQEYLPSYTVDLTINETNPTRVHIRDIRLGKMHEGMSGNDTVRLQYASKYRSLANAYKKWKGEMLGLKRFDGMAKKQDYEKQFQLWADADPSRKVKYGKLLEELSTSYKDLEPLSRLNDYTAEAANGIELLSFSLGFQALIDSSKSINCKDSVLNKMAEKLATGSQGFFKNYNKQIDKNIFYAMMVLMKDSLSKELKPAELIANENNLKQYTNIIYDQSLFVSKEKLKKFLETFKRKKFKTLDSDKAFVLAKAFKTNFENKAAEQYNNLNYKINLLMRTYMKAQREMNPEKKFYPDANLTLRVAYGNVKPYTPRDAVQYETATTLGGIMQKMIPGDEEFSVPEKLVQLYRNKDFGTYAVNGDVPVAFIASNHTTGGNSGSPVLNAKGELIGVNFDRVWEGTMSDIMFDPDHCRNIILDIRYFLFIVDKFAGAKNLVAEMKLVN